MSALTTQPAWVAVDWGSSNLRAWALDTHNRVLAQTASSCGMLSLAEPAAFEQALMETLGSWLDPVTSRLEVLVCGMAGARQGWCETPYLEVSKTPGALADQLARQRVNVEVQDPRLNVGIIPGLCQSTPHFDVMRGEETQLVGLLAHQPRFTGSVCLPGTHTKWAHLKQGHIEHFSTVMSGELFALLTQSSVLRHSLSADTLDDAEQQACFIEGVNAVLGAPATLSRELFSLRARDLLDPALPSDASRQGWLGARLSGLLLGLELAGHALELPKHAPVVLIGNAHLCRRYQMALGCLPNSPTADIHTDMTLEGLIHLYQRIHSTVPG